MAKGLLVLLAACFFLFSCRHENTGDKVRPTITIFNPIMSQHFNTGDTLWIKGICEDDQEIDEVPVHITDEATNSEFFHNHYGLIHSNVFNVDTYHVITTTTTTRYSVVIEAADIAGNKVEKEIVVNIN